MKQNKLYNNSKFNVMKKILILLIAACITTTFVSAQTTDVQQGSILSFTTSVSNGVAVTGYSWSADAALGTTISTPNAATTNVTFNGAINNTGNVSVYATSSTGSCNGPSISRNFLIVATLSLNAHLPVLAAICPYTANNPTGGDIPAFTINFVDGSNNPIAVTGFSYQIVNPLGVAGAVQNVTMASATSYNLDIATAYDNTQTGTYTIRLTAISNATTSVAYPDASGNYPNTTITVNLAPVLSPF
jgi:hypothetical protein